MVRAHLLVWLFFFVVSGEPARAASLWVRACGSLFSRAGESGAEAPIALEASAAGKLLASQSRVAELREGYFRALAEGNEERIAYHRFLIEEHYAARSRRQGDLRPVNMLRKFEDEYLPRRWPHVGERKVKYFTPDEVAAFEVKVGKDGRLYRPDGSLLDTRRMVNGVLEDKPGIFVMDLEGRVFAYQGPVIEVPPHEFMVLGDPQAGALIKHSSLTAGLPAASAGQIRAIEGRLLYLDPSSGHYRPAPDIFRQVETELARKGADLKSADIRRKFP